MTIMTSAVKFDAIGEISPQAAPMVRPQSGQPQRAEGQAAGPFDPDAGKALTARDALVTGLLVIYPAFAIVVAIVAGLWLKSAGS